MKNLLTKDSDKIIPLVLHKITDNSNIKNWEDVSQENFNWILKTILEKWINQDNSNDFTGFLTFDDGNLSDYEFVFPSLLEKNISGMFFLLVNKIGTKGYLNWDQIREMKKNGMSFGSHGYSHQFMTTLDKDEVFKEFEISKKILEDNIGENIDSFSYPYGDCSKKLHEIGFSADYKFLYTSNHGIAKKNSRIIPRNNIHSRMSRRDISKIITPNKSLIYKWKSEDIIKSIFKNTIGTEKYTKLRNLIFHD